MERGAKLRAALERHARRAAPVARRAAVGLGHALGAVVGVALAGILLVGIAFVAIVYSGWYNVAATEPGTRFGDWLLHTAMQRSVARRAEDITVPALDARDQVLRGAFIYRTSCEACHRGPGVARPGIAGALSPQPADLAQSAGLWQPREIYWIVRNGIRMSGMPAWASLYPDDDLWAIVAFVTQLPTMTAEDYEEHQRLAAKAHARRKK
jgi:mono/diheme cytochrome c family protein